MLHSVSPSNNRQSFCTESCRLWTSPTEWLRHLWNHHKRNKVNVFVRVDMILQSFKATMICRLRFSIIRFFINVFLSKYWILNFFLFFIINFIIKDIREYQWDGNEMYSRGEGERTKLIYIVFAFHGRKDWKALSSWIYNKCSISHLCKFNFQLVFSLFFYFILHLLLVSVAFPRLFGNTFSNKDDSNVGRAEQKEDVFSFFLCQSSDFIGRVWY